MPTTLQKLQYKQQPQILVLNAPESFEPEIAALTGTKVLRTAKGAADIPIALAFVTIQAEVDRLAPAIAAATSGDAILWFAYPKGSSKRYKSEVNRDRGWQALGDLGFEAVSNIAIDEDWSALRFRRVEFIKTMTRATHRLTAAGKARPAAATTAPAKK